MAQLETSEAKQLGTNIVVSVGDGYSNRNVKLEQIAVGSAVDRETNLRKGAVRGPNANQIPHVDRKAVN